MIGFAGYAFGAPAQPRAVLERMATRFALGPGVVARYVIQENFGLALVAREGRPVGLAEDSHRKLVVAVQGQFAPSCLAGDAVRHGPAAIASALMQLWSAGGTAKLRELNGRFAIAVWDGAAGELHLINDRLGMRRCCWTRTGETLLFGTEYKSFLDWPGLCTEPDDEAVAEFMAYGHPLQDKTLIKGVQLLAPGSHLSCQRSRLTLDRQVFDPPATERDGNLDGNADHLGETLKAVIAEYATALDQPLIIPLTGGLDARTILGFARQVGAPVSLACTFGHAHCHDVRLARRLARASGVPYRYINLRDRYMRDHGEFGLRVTEAERPARNYYYSVLGDTVPANSALWSGFLGDVLLGRPVLEYRPDPGLSEAQHLEAMSRRAYVNTWGGRVWGKQDLISSVVHPSYRDLFDQAPRATIHALLKAQTGNNLMQRATLVDMAQRQRRYTVSQLELMGRSFSVMAPFYDQRIQNLALSLPPNLLAGQRLYRRMITRFLPKLARVPDNHTLRPVSDIGAAGEPLSMPVSVSQRLWEALPPGARWRVDGMLSRYGIRQAWGQGLARVSGGWMGTHDRGMYAHYDQVLRKDPDFFSHELQSSELLGPYFDPIGVKRLLQAHLAGKTNAAIILFNLWTYTRWRHYLIEGDQLAPATHEQD